MKHPIDQAMSARKASRLRLAVTATVAAAALAHIAWEYFNGGIQSHHPLQREDLPAISNAWGLIALPLLAWFLGGRVLRRVATPAPHPRDRRSAWIAIAAGFISALALGIGLATAFTLDHSDAAAYLLGAALLAAMLVPVHRGECVLGFVLGMTFTFGAVLPIAVASLLAALSALFAYGVRPLLLRSTSAIRRALQPSRR